ncbi:MAG: hypothetical protein ACRER5_22455 [Pseudomonas sp.]
MQAFLETKGTAAGTLTPLERFRFQSRKLFGAVGCQRDSSADGNRRFDALIQAARFRDVDGPGLDAQSGKEEQRCGVKGCHISSEGGTPQPKQRNGYLAIHAHTTDIQSCGLGRRIPFRWAPPGVRRKYGSYLVDPASSHMLVSKIKPCMSKYKLTYTVKLRMAH